MVVVTVPHSGQLNPTSTGVDIITLLRLCAMSRQEERQHSAALC